MRGATIQYAEIDGTPVCILPDGQWCERQQGHDGPHVISPLIPLFQWDATALRAAGGVR
ncbi:hypothetical protein [Microbacterium maritypicum]|uniref:hypothetical protein n=1 Tax=Microbacterium maritypicum TaxID=33918 RepID=UPI003D748BF3